MNINCNGEVWRRSWFCGSKIGIVCYLDYAFKIVGGEDKIVLRLRVAM